MCACCFVSGVWSLVLASRMSYLASSALAAATARVTLDLFRVDAMIYVFCFHRSATRVDLVRGQFTYLYTVLRREPNIVRRRTRHSIHCMRHADTRFDLRIIVSGFDFSTLILSPH
jgi:hypothetical protein